MKIVLLDSRVLSNSGDVSWAPLQACGELVIHESTAFEHVELRAKDAAALLTVRVPLNRELIRKLTALRYIGVLGSDPGFLNVEAAKKRGIVVNHCAGADVESVAQHTFSLLLELTHGTGHHAHAVRNGRWSKAPDFTFRLQPLTELHGKIIGLIGFGRVGRAVARIARGFGMDVLIHEPTPDLALPDGEHAVPLTHLLANADVVSLHCALAPQTERLINAATLAQMKPTAYLLNTAHGSLLDEEAVAAALRERALGGVGVDVLSSEPPSPKNPLLRAPRTIITPHLAGFTRAVRQRIIEQAAEQLKQFQQTHA